MPGLGPWPVIRIGKGKGRRIQAPMMTDSPSVFNSYIWYHQSCMQLMECRFRRDQAVIEALFFTIASLMATAPFADMVDDRLHGFPENFLPGLALGALFLSALTWARWRSRIVLDDQGVEWRRSRRSAGTRLSW